MDDALNGEKTSTYRNNYCYNILLYVLAQKIIIFSINVIYYICLSILQQLISKKDLFNIEFKTKKIPTTYENSIYNSVI